MYHFKIFGTNSRADNKYSNSLYMDRLEGGNNYRIVKCKKMFANRLK